MKTTYSASLGESLKSIFNISVIIIEIVAAFFIYFYVLGDPSHFQDNNPENNPVQGDYLGIVYKGGYLVPILISLLLITITFSIERYLTIIRAKGKGNVKNFVRRIKSLVSTNNVSNAIEECDRQQGSVANVIRAGLSKYEELSKNQVLDPDKKVLLIQKDIEETTQLEMPVLEKNLVIIATIASIATLMGLLGTVLGMIKAFAAMATAGAPDAVELANGISEALINTALGIGTSALAIIFYNYFTTKIDMLTYGIDEASFTIIQNFSAINKE